MIFQPRSNAAIHLALSLSLSLALACEGEAPTSSDEEPAEGDEKPPADEEGPSRGKSDAGRSEGKADASARPSTRDAGRDAASPSDPPATSSKDGGRGGDATPPGMDQPGDAARPSDATTPSNDEPVVCPTMKLPPGSHDGKVAFGGHDRTYLLYVPKSYRGESKVPLVFDFHGYGQSVSSQKNASGFATLADQHDFAVVYPAGVGGSWHVNGCCGQAAQEKLDEIGAVRAMLKQIASELCVDPKRVYASGISQGGGMAHHVGCLAADVFAAVAPVSSDLRTDPCMPSRPISELSFRGMADALSAYEGGPVGPAGMQYQSIGAKPTLERWKMINECTGQPETTHELCQTYNQCAAGTEVTLCTIPRGGHALYNNPERLNLAEVAWEMFERQRLP